MFDFRRFLDDNFRKPQEVCALLRAYGAEAVPEESSVKKWFQRASVPSEWFAVLLAYIELDAGQPVRLAAYLTR